MSSIFSEKQQEQLKAQGISLHQAKLQLSLFKKGSSYAKLNRPCQKQDGILTFSPQEKQAWIDIFQNEPKKNLTHFIPASGAASRMFKKEFDLLNALNTDPKSSHTQKKTQEFLNNLPYLPFYPKIIKTLGKTLDAKKILEFILLPQGLNFGNLPKALVDFHTYTTGTQTPLEEQISEAISISQANTHIHFTVSESHLSTIQKILKQGQKHCHSYQFSLSTQLPQTDTLVQDENNDWVLNSNQELLLRPGGHGSLLHNLNALKSDLFFIKNIDNICHENHQEHSLLERRMILGLLISLQKQIFKALLQSEQPSETQQKQAISDLAQIYSSYFLFKERTYCNSFQSKKDFLTSFFNHPLRVCGVVKNTGKAGGGPFWVKQGNRNPSIQIIEESQIDLHNPKQKSIFNSSTHFNPVFIAGNTVDHHHQKFDLLQYQDNDSYLITQRSLTGQSFKVLEWPGLWNGGMAKWNTILVEINQQAFNPVKEVIDLNKKQHQP